MVLSLGCGGGAAATPALNSADSGIEYHKLRQWGAKEWARPIVRIASDGAADLVDHAVAMAFGQCRSTNYMRIQVDRAADDSLYDLEKEASFEVQTAPISDGVLPGIIRQLVIEVCSRMGIPIREVAPSWSSHELWREAFITSGLRLVQHVESVQVPISSKDFHRKNWNEVSWAVKRFEGVGTITTKIQKEIRARIGAEGYQISDIQ